MRKIFTKKNILVKEIFAGAANNCLAGLRVPEVVREDSVNGNDPRVAEQKADTGSEILRDSQGLQ